MAEPTGSIIRMPKVENALGQSTTSAASQKAVTDGINQAESAASTADGKAVTAQNTANAAQNTANAAQNTANAAQTAADNAQKTADEAKTAAGTAQTAATNANNNANGRVPSGRMVNGKALTADISLTAADVGALTKAQADGYYKPKGSSSGITLGAEESKNSEYYGGNSSPTDAVKAAFNISIPAKSVLTSIFSGSSLYITYRYRRITGGV